MGEPRSNSVPSSTLPIDDLELQIASLTVELKRQGADHRYIPLLVTAPGFGWVNAFTVASEIGDITRFASRPSVRLHRPLPARHPVRAGARKRHADDGGHLEDPVLGSSFQIRMALLLACRIASSSAYWYLVSIA
jgi:hypothetical protein